VPTPDPPTNYAAVVDIATVTLSWVNGAGAETVRHEVSYDGGATYVRLDDDVVPTTTSDHGLNQDAACLLRAKSVNADGTSGYTPPVSVVTGGYQT
jgi:hypothetical protein